MKRLLALLAYYCFGPPKWNRCTKASCWDGANAQTRHMNILSPHFSDDEFKRRVKWAEGRGCNTLHLFLINKADGEGAGYRVDNPDTERLVERRIVWARKRGMAIVLWIIADDSGAWARELFAAPMNFINAAKPLLKHASTVVLGLEMNEYGTAHQWQSLKDCLRRVYDGKIGTHHTSGKYDFAGIGDIVFAQAEPGKSAAAVKDATKRALSLGKPVNFFELDRHPNRELAQAALNAGAFGVGNW
jgi:hypothetical protein